MSRHRGLNLEQFLMLFAKPHDLGRVFYPPNRHPKWRNDQRNGQKFEMDEEKDQICWRRRNNARTIVKGYFFAKEQESDRPERHCDDKKRD